MADREPLDVRWLEPPEPFERIVAALERLPAGETLTVMIHREPHPLYRWLTREGWRHSTRYDAAGYFEIRINR
jgi:uncharacterized protein (DUF2249 family)